MRNLSGKFIVIDGGEGCGKSTQIALLRQAIASAGQAVEAVRDPGATRVGEMIRGILLDPLNTDMAMRCEMMLYMAARAQLMRQTIVPALAAGSCVLCDRFVSSTLAYQLGGDGLTVEEIGAVGNVAIGGRWPDLTIILDMPLEKSSARLQRAKDRIEQRPAEYHQRVRENFLAQAIADPQRVRVVAADRTIQAVHEEMLKMIEQNIG